MYFDECAEIAQIRQFLRGKARNGEISAAKFLANNRNACEFFADGQKTYKSASKTASKNDSAKKKTF